MPDFDTAWKEALDLFFEPFMSFFFPDVHGDIDWVRGFVMLDKELQQAAPESERGRRVVDKLIKVWRSDGQDKWVMVHVEVQSQQDKDFGERMYVYNSRLFDHYNRRVVSFAILGDNRPAWRPDRFSYELWGTRVGIEFATVKLLDYAADEAALESHPNPFAVVVLAHLKAIEATRDANARRAAEVRLVKGLYERGFGAEQIRQLYRLIDGMMGLPSGLADQVWKEIREFEKEKSMPFITGAERVGRAEGRAEGLAEGLAKAKDALLLSIEALLDVRFSTQGLALMHEIRQIKDLDLLQLILKSVKQADTPETVRRLWAKD
ncbi:MAG TPA: hypothetical protein VF278_07690 [Pirellulales bacterium]